MSLIENLHGWLMDLGLSEYMALVVLRLGLSVVVLLLAFIANLIAKGVIVRTLRRVADRTETKWDDIMVQRRVFTRLSHLAPAVVIYKLAPFALIEMPRSVQFTKTASVIYMIIAGIVVIDSLLNAIVDIYRTYDISRRIPIKGFIGGLKVILYSLALILIISTILNKDVGLFLGSMGALTAVLMLIFKDSILGLVAGVQLTTQNLVRRGDWIEMPKHGADGDVIDVTLTTVRVQNWDKTISTIPAYALISDSFKNWRGMSESGGRRIKRSISIDMTSVKICDREMLDRFAKIQHIAEHIEKKRKEVAEHNQSLKVSDGDLANGRHLTNIGTFRAYCEAYLRNHPNVHKYMTFLVRQLPPTEHGLPIEIYVFSNDQVWARYEAIQADIFDHLIAMIPHFDLRVFQAPTGADMRAMLING